MKIQGVSLDRVAGMFHPREYLGSLASHVGAALGAERIGVSRQLAGGVRFENVAVWDRSSTEITTGSVFSVKGTAGAWVSDFGCPMIGRSPVDMEAYPATLAYIVREEFLSNLLLPMDLGEFGRGVLYGLSRTVGSFGHSALAVGMRVRAIVEPALRAHLAASEFVNGQADEALVGDDACAASEHAGQSLNDVQRRHIMRVLESTNGIIEGPRGAASVLDVCPSTLRNRMRKLGIGKPTRRTGA